MELVIEYVLLGWSKSSVLEACCRKEDRASYGLSLSGEADILRPIREDGFRQSPTETMYEVSVQN